MDEQTTGTALQRELRRHYPRRPGWGQTASDEDRRGESAMRAALGVVMAHEAIERELRGLDDADRLLIHNILAHPALALAPALGEWLHALTIPDGPPEIVDGAGGFRAFEGCPYLDTSGCQTRADCLAGGACCSLFAGLESGS